MNRRRHRIVGAALIRAGWLCGSWLTLTSWVAQASPADPARPWLPNATLLLKLFRDEDSAGTIPALKRLYEQRARLQTSAVQQEEAQQKRNAELALYQSRSITTRPGTADLPSIRVSHAATAISRSTGDGCCARPRCRSRRP